MHRTIEPEHVLLKSDDSAEQYGVWELYHENSKLHLWDIKCHARIAYVNWSLDVQDLIRDAGWRFACAERVALPRSFRKTESSFDEIVLGRRSVRAFADKAVPLVDVAKLLYFSMGETAVLDIIEGDRCVERPLRVCPSGGALYPIECYLIPFNIEGLDRDKTYHYSPSTHELEVVRDCSCADSIEHAAFPGLLKNAAGLFVYTAVFLRSAFKYGERSYRFILQESGHIAQNVLLTALGLGLDGVVIGGFLDDQVNELLRVDATAEATIYMVAFGASNELREPLRVP